MVIPMQGTNIRVHKDPKGSTTKGTKKELETEMMNEVLPFTVLFEVVQTKFISC